MKMQKVLHFHLEAAKKKPKYISRQYAMFEKYDGWYGYADFSKELIMPHIIRSSTGRHIPAVDDLAQFLFDRIHEEGRLIFEILVSGAPKFHTLNGILNRKNEQANAYLMVHDFIPTHFDWIFQDRYNKAVQIVDDAYGYTLRTAPILGVSDDPDVWHYNAKEIWRRGGEGLILKDLAGTFHPGKRNATLMKIKEEVTLDLLVIGVVQGEGKYAHTTGAIKVMDRQGHTLTISGMSDKERGQWWEDPEGSIINKVVEVKAMKILPDGSLREPRYKAIRYNKFPSDIDAIK